MANPADQPDSVPAFVTGSRAGDRALGIVIGVAWWGAGGLLIGVASPWLFWAVLAGFIWQFVPLGRNPKARTLVRTIIWATILVPVVVLLGVFGMCASSGFRYAGMAIPQIENPS